MRFINLVEDKVQQISDEESVTVYNCSPLAEVELLGEPNSFLYTILGPLSKVTMKGVKKLSAMSKLNATIAVEALKVANPPVEVNQVLGGRKFYIDAGHGGKDPGAVNTALGLEEKVAALDVAKILATLLKERGALVYMSREDDTYPSINQRAQEANVYGVDGFISIHLNSAENKAAQGVETLCYSYESKAGKWADKVQACLVDTAIARNRGVKQRPDLGVLKYTKMPAILCEIGFISNNEEAQKLFNPIIQAEIAGAIAQGTVLQFGV